MPRKTRSEMRVLIAKDVLKLLRTDRVTIETGRYFSPSLNRSYPFLVRGLPLDPIGPKLHDCSVCALGAMFISEVDRNNRLYVQDLNDRPISTLLILKRLLKYFSKTALASIESAFEGSSRGAPRMGKYEARFYQLRDRIPDDSLRLKVLMKNIIRNKGLFKLEQEFKRWKISTS